MCEVKLEGAVSGSEARIGQPNIMICKSVMHIVDAVLLPAPIADLAAGKVSWNACPKCLLDSLDNHRKSQDLTCVHKRCSTEVSILHIQCI